MQFMEERILKDGQVRAGNILKVDNFLNHQVDVDFLSEMGKAFYDHFCGRGISKVLTVEASGIAVGSQKKPKALILTATSIRPLSTPILMTETIH